MAFRRFALDRRSDHFDQWISLEPFDFRVCQKQLEHFADSEDGSTSKLMSVSLRKPSRWRSSIAAGSPPLAPL